MSLSLQQIDQGIEALLENAYQLITEAEALLGISAFSRAFALAHLAREEQSKAAMLQATGMRMLAKQQVDWKRLMARLRDHKAKLRLELAENVFLLKGAGVEGISDEMLTADVVASMAERRNREKNNSLYVGFEDGIFVLPSKSISEHKARRTVLLAKLRLEQLRYIEKRTPSFEARKNEDLSHLGDLDKIAGSLSPEQISTISSTFFHIIQSVWSDIDSERKQTADAPPKG